MFQNTKTQIERRLKNKNQILFRQNDLFFDEINQIIKQTCHRSLIYWALELAHVISVDLNIKYPHEPSITNVIVQTTNWARGDVKMAVAKNEILNCHRFAKELDNKEDIALLHALAQGCSTVHTASHALGLPIYELTALVLRHGIDDLSPLIEKRAHYLSRLIYWKNYPIQENEKLASFIKTDAP